MTYRRDPRVDDYIAGLPDWQKDLLYDGALVPDPDRIISGGHTNKTAPTVSLREGDRINRRARTAMLKQIIANNRAGGWRKLKSP